MGEQYDRSAPGSRLETIGHGVKKGVDPRPNIKKINYENIDKIEHFPGWPSIVAVKAVERQAGNGINGMAGLYHIVLLFRKKTMLGRKKAGQLAWKTGVDQIATVAELAVSGSLIAEKSESVPRKPLRWCRNKLFDPKGYH